ncbi:MAG: ArsR/SmtB family transcription factor [Phycisphaerales bacterium]
MSSERVGARLEGADDPLDAVFRALSSPVRRRLLDMLRGGALSTSDLGEAFPELSRFAIMQHLGVLEEANLIVAIKTGRVKMNYLNAAPLREMYERWVGRFEGHWAAALVGLKRTLEESGEDRASSRAKEKGRARGKAGKKGRSGG